MASGRPTKDSRRLHEAAWPDMFVNLQAAYAELTRAQFELERRALELAEAHDLFQRVLESMSEALFLMDSTGRLLQVNAAASALLGIEKEGLVGRSFTEVCGNGDLPATPWRLLERAPGGTLTNQDVELRTRSGTVPVSISYGLVRDKRGKITGTLAVARDITERKRAEEALARQAQDLARSNTELQQFAYVASHDLQEPLRMMASFAELLARRYSGRLDADADEFIQYVVDGAQRMQSLINGLLLYSRVGRLQTAFGPVQCSQVLEAVLANLRAAIEESAATVTSDPLPVVLGEETRIIQLFQNLLGNALKFRGEEPPRVHVGARLQEGRWLFFVRDNGIGIEPQYADRIFLIFQRLHTRREYPGAGLGLAICKKIVESHGGQIWFESKPGEGTTFSFTLPACEEAE